MFIFLTIFKKLLLFWNWAGFFSCVQIQAICTFSKLLTFVIMCRRWVLSKWFITLLLHCMTEFVDGKKCKWCWISRIAYVILVPVWTFFWKLWLLDSQQMAIFSSGPLTYLVFEIICLHSSEELHSLGLYCPAASQVCVHVPCTLWSNKATFKSAAVTSQFLLHGGLRCQI